MQKLLLGAIIGGLVGVALGVAFAAGGLLAIGPLHQYAARVVSLCGGVAGFVGMFVGAVSGGSYAVGGGNAKSHVAAVALAFAGGALAAHRILGSTGGDQLLYAGGAALSAASIAAARGWLVRRRRDGPADVRPWQRWFQFRLSTLLAVFVVTSATLATLISQPVMERRAIAVIERDGGRVRYEIAPPSWVSFLAGDAWAVGTRGSVSSVRLNRTSSNKADNATLAWVAALPDVRFLDINCTLITDEGLASLKHLRKLTSLCVHAPISDRGLQHLSSMTQLVDLDLVGTKITDRGLIYVEGMTQLVSLDLRGTQVTDAGLEHLHGLKNLRTLRLDRTAVSDTGLAKLRELTGLEWLDMSRTSVSDAGLKHLLGLKRLRRLDLSSTNVSDAGLDELEKLPELFWVNLVRSKVTAEGLERIMAVTKRSSQRWHAGAK